MPEPVSTETPPTPSTPTPPQPPTPTKDPNQATIELYDRILAEKQAEIDKLNRERNTVPPVVETPTSREDFFADPAKHVDELIKRRLSESTDGLNKFVAVQRRRDALANYRSIVSNNPNVVKFWPHISAKFDVIANKYIEENDVNEQLVGATVQNLIAQYAMENPLEYAALIGKEVTPLTPKTPVIPPHISPSDSEPPTPVAISAPVLTENEMRLARERWPNLSQADAYKKYDELRRPGSFVIESKKMGAK